MISLNLIRTFIAIAIPEPAVQKLAGLFALLRAERADVKWVRPEGLHITLKFLGDVDPGRIGDIGQAIAAAAVRENPLALRLQGFGGFPSLRSPRVFWIGMEGDTGRLIELAARIDRGTGSLGFPAEERPFKPHLTIGRVRSAKGLSSVVETLQRNMPAFDPFTAGEIRIMKSDLKPAGAEYTVLKSIQLQG